MRGALPLGRGVQSGPPCLVGSLSERSPGAAGSPPTPRLGQRLVSKGRRRGNYGKGERKRKREEKGFTAPGSSAAPASPKARFRRARAPEASVRALLSHPGHSLGRALALVRLTRCHARFVLSEPSGNGSVGLGSLREPLLPACRRDPYLSSGRRGGAAPRRPSERGAPRRGPARPSPAASCRCPRLAGADPLLACVSSVRRPCPASAFETLTL